MIHDARPPRTFETLPTIDGFDVIDAETGHPVDHRDSLHSANGVAYRLNDAVLHGGIEVALGAKRMGRKVPTLGR